jgi:hypothetical protein
VYLFLSHFLSFFKIVAYTIGFRPYIQFNSAAVVCSVSAADLRVTTWRQTSQMLYLGGADTDYPRSSVFGLSTVSARSDVL